MVTFLFVLLVCQTYFYLKIDREIYGTFITPISALTLPYLLVVLTHILFHKILDFKAISPLSILVWNIGTLLFWLFGVLLAKMALKKKVTQPFVGVKGLDVYVKGLYPFVLFITLIFVIIMLFSFAKSVKSFGLNNINSEDFATMFAGGGIFGYSLIFLRFLMVYLIVVTSRKKLFANIFILLIVAFSLLYQVKGWLLIPVMAAFIIRFFIGDEKRGKMSGAIVKRVLLISLVGVFFFSLSYYISLGAEVPPLFIFTHFFHYLWSGIIGFSEYLNSNLPIGDLTSQIFNPIVNVFNKLIGSEMDSVVNPHFFNTYNVYYKGSNVSTFFGSILVSAGYLSSIFIVFLFSILNYGLLIGYLNNKNIFNLISYSFFLIALFFGWFNFYYQHLLFYIIFIVGVMLNLLFVFSKNNSNEKNNLT